jgi:hypothetical protein
MLNQNVEQRNEAISGQKYAFATAAFMLGIGCFINLLGIEKAALAIIFACMALRSTPQPALEQRRSWAKIGLVMGILQIVLVVTVLLIFHDRFAALLDALKRLQ